MNCSSPCIVCPRMRSRAATAIQRSVACRAEGPEERCRTVKERFKNRPRSSIFHYIFALNSDAHTNNNRNKSIYQPLFCIPLCMVLLRFISCWFFGTLSRGLMRLSLKLNFVCRFNKREEAQEAVAALNNVIPQGGSQSLTVRVADDQNKAGAGAYSSSMHRGRRTACRSRPKAVFGSMTATRRRGGRNQIVCVVSWCVSYAWELLVAF